MSKSTTSARKKDPNGALLVNILLVFFTTILAAVLVDGYLLHPIPASAALPAKDYMESQLDLSKSGTDFADAKIVRDDFSGGNFTFFYMVEKDGQRYMLQFNQSIFTQRFRLCQAIPVEPGCTGVVNFSNLYARESFVFADGICVQQYGTAYYSQRWESYVGFAALVTAVETFLFCQIRKRRRKAAGIQEEEFVPVGEYRLRRIEKQDRSAPAISQEEWDAVQPKFNYFRFVLLGVGTFFFAFLLIRWMISEQNPFGLEDWTLILVFLGLGVCQVGAWKMVGDWKFDRDQMIQDQLIEKLEKERKEKEQGPS